MKMVRRKTAPQSLPNNSSLLVRINYEETYINCANLIAGIIIVMQNWFSSSIPGDGSMDLSDLHGDLHAITWSMNEFN